MFSVILRQFLDFCGNYFIWRYVYGTRQVERYGGALPATSTFAGDGGQATAANFNNVKGMYESPIGVVYITDALNNRILTIDKSGIVSTSAGDRTEVPIEEMVRKQPLLNSIVLMEFGWILVRMLSSLIIIITEFGRSIPLVSCPRR